MRRSEVGLRIATMPSAPRSRSGMSVPGRRKGTLSMDPRTAASLEPDPDAVEFIRFCYRRRRVGWPELYDEMCAVAARGLFRGYGSDDLAALGIGFSLFDMPALAAMSSGVVAQEQALRRPVTVTIAPAVDEALDAVAHVAAAGSVTDGGTEAMASRTDTAPGSVHFVSAAAPA
jgi:hypothetical protein